ncbi:cis-aconitate decarboxylase [Brienomyrus brachyistius]|uniref:cis-aconitate decarboxylase n=1 Tax=Brienomyrus brachyistius TaxID=42636 RepID=UPI0020B3C6AD|nr:cis-aconitate decarboxylase [Brienomyrus brachyistius]
MLRKSVTQSFGAAISSWTTDHLTDTVVRRSKRMILDTLGVGLLGTSTPVFQTALQYSRKYEAKEKSSIWGRPGLSLPAQYSAFVNGIAVHAMDFDDTWHPATHPSGAVLPALLALAETLPDKPSGLQLLLAFNIGIEVQGRLMRFSNEAQHIPKRFHPPSVVGVMGSTAATSKLLGLSSAQCVEALGIAASYAGAPMANAATQTKPLHIGNATRRGLEASLLALFGLEGNKHILDIDSGFRVFYKDYTPTEIPSGTCGGSFRWVLEDQDVAFKRFPAHLGMHWVAEAAAAVREKLLGEDPNFDFGQVRKVTLRVPKSKYIDCPFPKTEHEARHSFQFNGCSALLDGHVSTDSFTNAQIERKSLKDLLLTTQIENPEDNPSNFDKMYCEVQVQTADGRIQTARCDTFYGHWRNPLKQVDLVRKFNANATTVLSLEVAEDIVSIIDDLENIPDCTVLSSCLQTTDQSARGASVCGA